MKLKTKYYVSKQPYSVFSSALKEVSILNGVENTRDRIQNQVKWLVHQPGDLVFAQHLRELMQAVNSGVKDRNEALKNNEDYEVGTYYNNSSIIRTNIAKAEPLEFTQLVFQKYLADSLPVLQLPSELKNFQDSDTLVISYRTAFVRIPYKLIESKVQGSNIILNLKQVFNYYNVSRGINPETNTKLDDLYTLQDLLKQYPEKTPNLGVISENGDYLWFNNLKVTDISIKESNAVIGDLTERPENWTDKVGEDLNTEIGGNFKYAKSREAVLGKEYEENIEWQSLQKTFNVTLTISYDTEIESLAEETIQGSLITAERLNKFKEYTNKLSSACICNCNYCTCDCNYCTCDCNYCTCNCNYCTCNCNYCTCNCNYKHIDADNTAKQYPEITQYTRNICTCDSNRKEYNRYGEYGYIGWAASCPSNREYMLNKDGSIWMAPVANVELSCVCDNNYTENKYKTPFFANLTDNTEFVKKYDEEIPNTGPRFSTAETYADGEFIETRKSTNYYQVCTCDVNTKLVDKSQEYNDVSEYYNCVCNADKNEISGEIRYRFETTQKFKEEGYKIGENYPKGLKTITYKEASCPSNREIKYLVDWTQFWNNTIYKAGRETK